MVATTSWDHAVRLWAGPRGRGKVRVLTGHTGGVLAAAFNRSATRLATGGQDRTVRIWDTSNGRLLHTLSGHQGPVRYAAFLDDGSVVSVAEDGTIRRWSLDTRAVLRRICHAVGDTDRSTWKTMLPDISFEPGCP